MTVTRYGMLIDLRNCIGCNACTTACKISNGTPPGMFYSHVEKYEEGTYPNANSHYVPVLCNHCENPTCVDVCPTGASHVDENGVVCIDRDKCIGCRYCITACPYQARSFLSENIKGYFPDKGLTPQEEQLYKTFQKGTVYKCEFCKDKGYDATDEGPACVQTCPTHARIFGDLDDPDSDISKKLAADNSCQLAPEYGTDPRVRYIARGVK